MMKKIFLLLIFVLTIKGYAQTYTAKVAYEIPGNLSYSYTYNYSFGGQSGKGVSGGGVQHEVFTNVAHQDIYELYVRGVCGPTRDDICTDRTSETIQNIIIDPRSLSWGCGCVTSGIIEFTPNNLTISNKKSNIVCSGEQLELEASSPIAFKNEEVYHWQYSFNQVDWIDVPSSIGVNPKTNNTPLTTFSINELLGATSEQYFNKQIYFRLGYDDNRPFSNVIPITFSPCAPVIESIAIDGPKCSGDPMTVIVTFDKPLDPSKNEILKDFQIIKKDGQLTGNQIPEIKIFDISNPLQYTYNNVVGLENGARYSVKYQAFQGTKERGIPQTQKDFPYSEPAKFNFSATTTPALCNGENGAIEILAWGGSGTYKYQLDGGTETAFTIPAVFDQIETTKQKIVIPADSKPNPNPLILTNHSILVTDSKGCIDKTAND